MGKFSTSGKDGQNLDSAPVRNWFGYGIHKASITGFEIKVASTGTEQVKLNFETLACTEKGFKADSKAIRWEKIRASHVSLYEW